MPPKTGKKNAGKPSSSNGPATSKSAKRRLRRKAAMTSVDSSMKKLTLSNPISMSSDTGLRRLQSLARRPGLSDAGIAFLKCAFAPPDFQASSIAGVPDTFQGQTLTRKHRFVLPQTLSAANDYYYLLAPVPGVSHFVTTTTAGQAVTGTALWTPVFYSDASSMFASPTTSTNVVTKFRYISNHFEIIPTVNQMTWSGSIQAWKLPVQVVARSSTATSNADMYSVTGLQSVNSNIANQYTGPFIMGVYTGAYSSNPDFAFQTILENQANIPSTVQASDFGQLAYTNASPSNLACPGLDNGFETIIIRVSGVSANETCLIKTWSCVEYQVQPSNSLYEFSGLSPRCDPIAMELYREVISNLPVAVGFEDNENFWQRVLQIIRNISGVGAVVPGPIGMASRGVNLLSNAALSLYS